MPIERSLLMSGNQPLIAASLGGQLITSQGIPLIWLFESPNVPSTGVQFTKAISPSTDYTLQCRALYLSEPATVTINANGGEWATFTGRSYQFGELLWLNPLNSLEVTHTSPDPITLITLVASPALIAERTTWV